MKSGHWVAGSLLLASSAELKALEVIIDSVESGEPLGIPCGRLKLSWDLSSLGSLV